MTSENNHSLDDLLSDLKSQYQKPDTLESPNKAQKVDNLLEEVKSQLNTNKTSAPANQNRVAQDNAQVDRYLDSLKAQYKNQQPAKLDEVKSQLKAHQTSAPANNAQVNDYLNSLKSQYKHEQKWQKNQAELTYNRNKQEIILQEQQKQLKLKQSIRQAEKWLANLDPSSEEGIWFNQLAESYPSKLDAAISYLSTLEQSNS